MRGVTAELEKEKRRQAISTHTPHARRDANKKGEPELTAYISTHTPHARRDCYHLAAFACAEDFNSHASCEA